MAPVVLAVDVVDQTRRPVERPPWAEGATTCREDRRHVWLESEISASMVLVSSSSRDMSAAPTDTSPSSSSSPPESLSPPACSPQRTWRDNHTHTDLSEWTSHTTTCEGVQLVSHELSICDTLRDIMNASTTERSGATNLLIADHCKRSGVGVSLVICHHGL